MTNIKAEYVTLIRELLEDVYCRKRETGNISRDVETYVKGFFDTGLNLGLITKEELNTIIEEINIQVFGKTLDEQREMFKGIHNTYEDYIDAQHGANGDKLDPYHIRGLQSLAPPRQYLRR